MLFKIMCVFIGGGTGALLRYFISISAKKFFILPLIGTFIANIIGCFVIGFLFALTLNKTNALPDILKLLIITGFLGGLTTFSTLNIEVFELIKTGKIFYGFLYMLISCILGLLFTYLGYCLYSKI